MLSMNTQITDESTRRTDLTIKSHTKSGMLESGTDERERGGGCKRVGAMANAWINEECLEQRRQ